MFWIILIAAFVLFGVGYWLYTIGRKTKKQEKELEKWLNKEKVKAKKKRNLHGYSRKHYARVPTISKKYNKK